ncbi:MAG: lysophospholipase [Ferruginibacter sp.]|nr:lysophospholipase [Ferruginibacter sp.]
MYKSGLLYCWILYALLSCTKPQHMQQWKGEVKPDTLVATVPVVVNDSSQVSFLALGDSYTIGQSVNAADRFPIQTAKLLNQEKIECTQPDIIAVSGWTTGNLLGFLAETDPPKPVYDIVTLLIGVNNQYQNRPKDEYGREFLLLLNRAIQYAGNRKNRVIVLSIPDYSVTPFASHSDTALIAKEIDEFNAVNRSIAQQAGVQYLNVTGFTRLAANDPSLIAADGLHPSGAEYTVWAQALVPVIKAALQ